MDDNELLAKIDREESMAYGINDAQLSNERANAIDYYLGKPFGNEIEGRSQVVSFDVQDTVEAALPQLLKIFTSGNQTVRFNPKGPEDEAAAEQETDYINHIVMEQNPGFSMFYTWFKDALVSKNGYVKVYYENEEESVSETYKGLSDEQLTMLVNDERVTVVEHSQFPNGMGGLIHDVKISVKNEKNKICVENVPPEDMMVSVDAFNLDLQNARFVQHRKMMSIDELKESGFDVPDNLVTDNNLYQLESTARDLYSESFDRVAIGNDDILVRDTYYLVDGKRMRYVIAGNTILHREEVELVPFVSITPILMPHRHIGRSYADLTMDIQLIKSTLIRGQLDNMYLSNNGRYAISDRVNLEDMLVSRPGGVVRVQGEPSAAIMPLQHTPFPPVSFTMVEYMDTMKEKRTGITSYNQGLDSESLNKTATGITKIMDAAAMRLELVARLFAETGVKQLFMMVHRMVRMYYTKPDIIRLRNQWVEVDPREWSNRKDMTINVGLGNGNNDAQLNHLQVIFMAQKEALASGLNIVNESNIYNSLVKLTQQSGFKNPELFWTDPKTAPPKQPQEDPKITIEKMKIEADQQKFAAEAHLNDAVGQKDIQAKMAQEQAKMEVEIVLEREKMALEAELEKFKAQLKAETDMKIAQMNAEMQVHELRHQMLNDERNAMIEQSRHDEKMAAMNRPKRIIRDHSGRAQGIE